MSKEKDNELGDFLSSLNIDLAKPDNKVADHVLALDGKSKVLPFSVFDNYQQKITDAHRSNSKKITPNTYLSEKIESISSEIFKRIEAVAEVQGNISLKQVSDIITTYQTEHRPEIDEINKDYKIKFAEDRLTNRRFSLEGPDVKNRVIKENTTKPVEKQLKVRFIDSFREAHKKYSEMLRNI